MKKHIIGIFLVICCISGYKYLYDKFLMPRYVLVSTGLMIAFVFASIKRRTMKIPKSFVFCFYLFFVLLSGLSVFWCINTGEAIWKACNYIMGLMVCVCFFDLLMEDYQVTKKVLWVSSTIILTVYLLFALIQIAALRDTSFEKLYNISGINGHKNLLSSALFMLSAFLLASLPVIKKKYLKAVSLVLFGLSILVMLFLKSRAVIVGMIVSSMVFLVLFLLQKRKLVRSRKHKTVMVVIGVVFSFLFLTVLLRHVVSITVPDSYEKSETQQSISSTSSLVERFALWDKTFFVVDNHPFLGCGAGNWQICYPEAGLKGLHRADYWNVNFTKTHNEFLGVLAENGYLGLMIVLIFLVFLIIFSGFAIIETTEKDEFYFGSMTLSIVCGFCCIAFFDFPNSRIEHLVWINILFAILFRLMVQKQDKHEIYSIGWAGNLAFLVLALFMILVGVVRFKGEQETVKMQQALFRKDWKNVEQFSGKAVSLLFSVDPKGMPLDWYHGQALKAMGNNGSLNSFRRAYHYVPFCKENLNDLGIDEYYTAGNYEQAKFLLHEAIRISPNYIYPYLNLACIYLGENEFRKAKEVIDMVDLDEEKCDFLKSEAGIFEPYNIEAEKQRIDADYDAVVTIRHIIDSLSCKNQE